MYDKFSTPTILDVFTQEVRDRGGHVSDTFNDGRRLFVRSLLPHVAPARPKDRMQGGLALRATDEELWLHPYLFREVCSNGAIMAQAIESLHVECLGAYTLQEGTAMLREAIAQCAEEQVFARSMRKIRSSTTADVDDLLTLMPHLASLQGARMVGFLEEIIGRFFAERDRTQFGLMNAVTSVARDTRNPDDRWRLEELGGGIGAKLRPRTPSDAPSRQRAEHELAPTG